MEPDYIPPPFSPEEIPIVEIPVSSSTNIPVYFPSSATSPSSVKYISLDQLSQLPSHSAITVDIPPSATTKALVKYVPLSNLKLTQLPVSSADILPSVSSADILP